MFKEDQVDCTVSQKAEVSIVDTPHVGQYGIRRKFWDYSKATKEKEGFHPWDLIWYDRWEKLEPKYESLNTNLESHRNVGDWLTHQFKGWFIPPATTRYRFYQSCDDNCRLIMADKPGTTDNHVKKLAPSMIAANKYCLNYDKNVINYGLRDMMACAEWVKEQVPTAKFFFFRAVSNWHCSPCPDSYKGDPVEGLSGDDPNQTCNTYDLTKYDEIVAKGEIVREKTIMDA